MNMRNLKNNVLKIKKVRKKVRFFRYRKIENLREINSKTIILKLNKSFFY